MSVSAFWWKQLRYADAALRFAPLVCIIGVSPHWQPVAEVYYGLLFRYTYPNLRVPLSAAWMATGRVRPQAWVRSERWRNSIIVSATFYVQVEIQSSSETRCGRGWTRHHCYLLYLPEIWLQSKTKRWAIIIIHSVTGGKQVCSLRLCVSTRFKS